MQHALRDPPESCVLKSLVPGFASSLGFTEHVSRRPSIPAGPAPPTAARCWLPVCERTPSTHDRLPPALSGLGALTMACCHPPGVTPSASTALTSSVLGLSPSSPQPPATALSQSPRLCLSRGVTEPGPDVKPSQTGLCYHVGTRLQGSPRRLVAASSFLSSAESRPARGGRRWVRPSPAGGRHSSLQALGFMEKLPEVRRGLA